MKFSEFLICFTAVLAMCLFIISPNTTTFLKMWGSNFTILGVVWCVGYLLNECKDDA